MGLARLLLLLLDVQLCHRLASQASSGTLRLHRHRCSPVPYAGQPAGGCAASASPCSFQPSLPLCSSQGTLGAGVLLAPIRGDAGSRCPARSHPWGRRGRDSNPSQCTAEPQLPSIPPPFAKLTSCHVNHTSNWRAGASWIINLPSPPTPSLHLL